ncbi:MFS multidrug transporter [Cordyceps fumosorosea ARSEF 2679]|uniref:MFS multidrug transporter n=1 Tax=Cordyceps fumosorosea (strain ARSEF 2679) TaxID=1081104 RepID=A0A167Q5I2_CORFA|nr:MFS multidrug transporter [Cordyceps fumosorosea ARSEF 2679]OAA57313.1 MFS multidrug transporter [Cordyceps fumosorosea ARSEF 2679]
MSATTTVSSDQRVEDEKTTPVTNLEAAALVVEPKEEEYPHGLQLVFVVLGILLCLFLAALDMTIVATAIPKITDEFRAIDQVGWYGSAFFLTLAAFQSFWGKLYRYCHLKYTYLAAGVVFEVGSLVCATAKDSTALIIGRAVTGIGGAGLYCGTYTIIAFIVPPALRARYTGLVGVSYAVASVAGPLIGGVFTDKISWRWCFYINLPIGGLSLALILLSFKPPAAARPVPARLSEILLQLDLLGVALAVVAMVCFFLVTQWAGASRPWDSASVIACLVVSVVASGLFIGVQVWQGERASLVPRILSKRVIYGVAAFAFFQNGMNFFFTYYIPIYFQSIDNYSAAQSGIYNLPLIFGACFFAIISGFLITIYGYYTVYMAAGSAACTVAAGLLYTMGMHTPLARPLGYQMLLGAGQGLAIQVPVIVAQAMSAPEDISASTAIILFFQMTGGAVCISAGQSAFINRLLYYLHSIAPGIDAARIVTIGASDLRAQVSAADIDAVLQAYLGALKDTFALGVGFAGCAFLASFIAPIRNLSNGSKVNVMAAL